jgi:flagellar biosynthesis GTPase FlhF
MGTLEMLVKLASFGTAGVCILAVFIVGKYILALPADSPSWKVKLMRRYQNMCIIIAVISMVAGGVNAYFNGAKIQKAQNEADTAINKADSTAASAQLIKDEYQIERQKTEAFKADMTRRLDLIQSQIMQNPSVPQEAKSNLNTLKVQTREFRMRPVEEISSKPIERRIDR